MGGKLFIPDRNFCVGVDDSSFPTSGEGQDLTVEMRNLLGGSVWQQNGSGTCRRECFWSLGKRQWIRCCAGLAWKDAGGTGSVRPGGAWRVPGGVNQDGSVVPAV